MKDNSIKERWREYFSILLREDYIGEIRTKEDISVANHTFLRRIRVVEVRKSLKQMNTGKTTGLDDILIEAWKCLREVGDIWLTRLFEKILMTKENDR